MFMMMPGLEREREEARHDDEPYHRLPIELLLESLPEYGSSRHHHQGWHGHPHRRNHHHHHHHHLPSDDEQGPFSSHPPRSPKLGHHRGPRHAHPFAHPADMFEGLMPPPPPPHHGPLHLHGGGAFPPHPYRHYSMRPEDLAEAAVDAGLSSDQPFFSQLGPWAMPPWTARGRQTPFLGPSAYPAHPHHRHPSPPQHHGGCPGHAPPHWAWALDGGDEPRTPSPPPHHHRHPHRHRRSPYTADELSMHPLALALADSGRSPYARKQPAGAALPLHVEELAPPLSGMQAACSCSDEDSCEEGGACCARRKGACSRGGYGTNAASAVSASPAAAREQTLRQLMAQILAAKQQREAAAAAPDPSTPRAAAAEGGNGGSLRDLWRQRLLQQRQQQLRREQVLQQVQEQLAREMLAQRKQQQRQQPQPQKAAAAPVAPAAPSVVPVTASKVGAAAVSPAKVVSSSGSSAATVGSGSSGVGSKSASPAMQSAPAAPAVPPPTCEEAAVLIQSSYRAWRLARHRRALHALARAARAADDMRARLSEVEEAAAAGERGRALSKQAVAVGESAMRAVLDLDSLTSLPPEIKAIKKRTVARLLALQERAQTVAASIVSAGAAAGNNGPGSVSSGSAPCSPRAGSVSGAAEPAAEASAAAAAPAVVEVPVEEADERSDAAAAGMQAHANEVQPAAPAELAAVNAEVEHPAAAAVIAEDSTRLPKALAEAAPAAAAAKGKGHAGSGDANEPAGEAVCKADAEVAGEAEAAADKAAPAWDVEDGDDGWSVVSAAAEEGPATPPQTTGAASKLLQIAPSEGASLEADSLAVATADARAVPAPVGADGGAVAVAAPELTQTPQETTPLLETTPAQAETPSAVKPAGCVEPAAAEQPAVEASAAVAAALTETEVEAAAEAPGAPTPPKPMPAVPVEDALLVPAPAAAEQPAVEASAAVAAALTESEVEVEAEAPGAPIPPKSMPAVPAEDAPLVPAEDAPLTQREAQMMDRIARLEALLEALLKQSQARQ